MPIYASTHFTSRVGILVTGLVLGLALTGCTSTVIVGNVVQNKAHLKRQQPTYELVGLLVAYYPRTSLYTVSVANPKGYDFSNHVREFAEYAGIDFSESAAKLQVRYAIERTTGAWTGPQIRNYLVAANLVVLDPISGGYELIVTANTRFHCTNDRDNKNRADYCATVIDNKAREVLYQFNRPGPPLK